MTRVKNVRIRIASAMRFVGMHRWAARLGSGSKRTGTFGIVVTMTDVTKKAQATSASYLELCSSGLSSIFDCHLPQIDFFVRISRNFSCR